jgi:hypothetical protein
VACNRWRLGCVDLYVGQEVGLREREQKGTEEVLASWRLMRSLAFKETALNFEAGVSLLKRRNYNMSLFLSSRGVKDNRTDACVSTNIS